MADMFWTVTPRDYRDRIPEPTPNEVAEALTRALPHGAFRIDPMPQDGPGVLRVLCRCDRALRWIGELPSDVLAWWLADHDDDMFLTPAQLDRKYNEQLPAPLLTPQDLRPTRTCGVPLGSTDGRIRCRLDVSMPLPASYFAAGGIDTGNRNHWEPHYWTDGANRTYYWTDNEAGG